MRRWSSACADRNIRGAADVNLSEMSKERAAEEPQHAGVRRSLRREQQRRKARQGMRVAARPDGLRPVTFRRVKKLTEGAGS